MPSRPIYRWKSFWLGVVVLVFLGWAWLDSIKHDSGIGIVAAGRPLGASSREATVALSEVDQIVSFGGHWRIMDLYRLPTTTPSPLPPLSFSAIDAGPALIFRLRIPYWLIMLAFILPWTAFLAWRWRRKGRLAESGP